jgi:hypothetical protein
MWISWIRVDHGAQCGDQPGPLLALVITASLLSGLVVNAMNPHRYLFWPWSVGQRWLQRGWGAGRLAGCLWPGPDGPCLVADC